MSGKGSNVILSCRDRRDGERIGPNGEGRAEGRGPNGEGRVEGRGIDGELSRTKHGPHILVVSMEHHPVSSQPVTWRQGWWKIPAIGWSIGEAPGEAAMGPLTD